MENVYYKYNDAGEYIKVHEFKNKRALAVDDRKKLTPFGDEKGQFSTEIGEEVAFQWIENDDYIGDYGPRKKPPPKKKKPVISLDEYGPNEEQLLREIRKENAKTAKVVKAPSKKKEIIYDKKTVIILNTDSRVCEYDIYDVCKQYGCIKYIYNTNSKYNNIIFVVFYDKNSGIECCNGVRGMVYNGNVLETQFMGY